MESFNVTMIFEKDGIQHTIGPTEWDEKYLHNLGPEFYRIFKLAHKEVLASQPERLKRVDTEK